MIEVGRHRAAHRTCRSIALATSGSPRAVSGMFRSIVSTCAVMRTTHTVSDTFQSPRYDVVHQTRTRTHVRARARSHLYSQFEQDRVSPKLGLIRISSTRLFTSASYVHRLQCHEGLVPFLNVKLLVNLEFFRRSEVMPHLERYSDRVRHRDFHSTRTCSLTLSLSLSFMPNIRHRKTESETTPRDRRAHE
jgi:hypothetical protein